MNMIRIITGVLLLLGGCSVGQTGGSARSQAGMKMQEKASNKEFDAFYARFLKDSAFQIRHVDFPLAGGVGTCDSLFSFVKESWVFVDSNYINDGMDMSTDSTVMHHFQDSTVIQQIRPEIGVLFEMRFKKTKTAWRLVYMYVESC